MAPSTILKFVSDLTQVSLPPDSVVIMDRSLPVAIREHFPRAILVSAGESLKSVRAWEKLASQVLTRTQDRELTLVGVGGGSVGDAVGFLSSVLWRGVGLIHVPTTLLAMVDSAHGGKTALNLGDMKNQLGTFYPANKIWIVRSILSALPPSIRDEGMVELFKALLLGDPVLVRKYLRDGWSAHPLWDSLKRAIRVKQAIVRKDPNETKGFREHLNLGHTLGHALETSTELSHGHSVAWGLSAALVASEKLGLTQVDELLDFLWPLLKSPRRWPTDAILENRMRGDKKQRAGTFRSVLLPKLGKPRVVTSFQPQDWTKQLQHVRRRLNV